MRRKIPTLKFMISIKRLFHVVTGIDRMRNIGKRENEINIYAKKNNDEKNEEKNKCRLVSWGEKTGSARSRNSSV